MKAITLTQPWATLVALGEKKLGTRGWQCYYGGPLAIHAAKTYKKREYADLVHSEPFYSSLRPGGVYCDPLAVLGHVIAISSVVRCLRIDSEWQREYPLTEKEKAFGNFGPARFVWILGPVQRIVPVPAVGKQLLWDWDAPYQVIA
jgi:activating signal cointegrator 1